MREKYWKIAARILSRPMVFAVIHWALRKFGKGLPYVSVYNPLDATPAVTVWVIRKGLMLGRIDATHSGVRVRGAAVKRTIVLSGSYGELSSNLRGSLRAPGDMMMCDATTKNEIIYVTPGGAWVLWIDQK